MATTVMLRNLSKETMHLIYDKQAELQKKKLRRVSIEQTIEILLKEAYLSDKERKN